MYNSFDYNSDVGYSDNGKECKTSCKMNHGSDTRWYSWCRTGLYSTEWCTPNSGKLFTEFLLRKKLLLLANEEFILISN